ncbi:MAG: GTP pyrophosphokinase family protein [Clostridiales bacterium]|nr:GTP pyrophosphokinase family protein [Clostridiales bacterium]
MAEQHTEIRENVYDWQNIMFLYNSAIKEVRTKLDIMSDEFQFIYQYNPIEYIKSRIKTPESIVNKLRRDGYETTMKNMVEHVSDIAGIRVVCSFTSDIYRLAEAIGKQEEISVLYIKDYIKHPKESGYRSYHMHIQVPIQTTKGIVPTKVELQIRTIAMDFWASLEHKIYYKFEGDAPDYISEDLQSCARIVAKLDEKMLSLNEAIMEVEARKKQGSD